MNKNKGSINDMIRDVSYNEVQSKAKKDYSDTKRAAVLKQRDHDEEMLRNYKEMVKKLTADIKIEKAKGRRSKKQINKLNMQLNLEKNKSKQGVSTETKQRKRTLMKVGLAKMDKMQDSNGEGKNLREDGKRSEELKEAKNVPQRCAENKEMDIDEDADIKDKEMIVVTEIQEDLQENIS